MNNETKSNLPSTSGSVSIGAIGQHKLNVAFSTASAVLDFLEVSTMSQGNIESITELRKVLIGNGSQSKQPHMLSISSKTGTGTVSAIMEAIKLIANKLEIELMGQVGDNAHGLQVINLGHEGSEDLLVKYFEHGSVNSYVIHINQDDRLHDLNDHDRKALLKASTLPVFRELKTMVTGVNECEPEEEISRKSPTP